MAINSPFRCQPSIYIELLLMLLLLLLRSAKKVMPNNFGSHWIPVQGGKMDLSPADQDPFFHRRRRRRRCRRRHRRRISKKFETSVVAFLGFFSSTEEPRLVRKFTESRILSTQNKAVGQAGLDLALTLFQLLGLEYLQ